MLTNSSGQTVYQFENDRPCDAKCVNDYLNNPAASMWFGDSSGQFCNPTTGAQCRNDLDCKGRTTYAERCAAPLCQPLNTNNALSISWLKIGSWTIYTEVAPGQVDPVFPTYQLSFVTNQGKYAKYAFQDDGNILSYCPCPYTGSCDKPYQGNSLVSGLNQSQTKVPDDPDRNAGSSGNGCSFPCTNQYQNLKIQCLITPDCNYQAGELCAGRQCIPNGGTGVPYQNPMQVNYNGSSIYEDTNNNLIFYLRNSNKYYVMLSGRTGPIGCPASSVGTFLKAGQCIPGASNDSGAVDIQLYSLDSNGNINLRSSMTLTQTDNHNIFCPRHQECAPRGGGCFWVSTQTIPGRY